MNDFLDVKKQETRLKCLLRDFPETDKQLINQALELVKEKHAGQKRDEGTSFVIHLIRVACSLIEEATIKNTGTVCAAILHDTVEDTDLNLEIISQKFGKRVKEIIAVLTRIKAPDETEENRYERKYQHFLKTLNSDKEIKSIKACDYLDNVRSWPHIPEDRLSIKKLFRWFKEGENMYLPLAGSVSLEMTNKMRGALDVAKTRWKDYLEKST